MIAEARVRIDEPEYRHRALSELIASDGWFILCEALDKQVARLNNEVMNEPVELSNTSKKLGAILAFKTVLDEPQTIIEQALYEAEDDRKLAERRNVHLRPVPRNI